MPVTLGRYQLQKRLAVGGMAEVFLAETSGGAGLPRHLVVKRILPQLAGDEQFVSMFLNEARLAAVLNHANIVQIFELGRDGDDFYLSMELVDGPDLSDLNQAAVAAGLRVPAAAAIKVISLACEGLAYAHEWVDAAGVPQRLVHRDISPHNILISRRGEVKVADFGIAKAASIPSVTVTGKIKGKLKYMSPEQIREQPLDLRSDVWAMGVTLYEVLTGVRPFEGSTDLEALERMLKYRPVSLAERGVEGAPLLQPIVDCALAKDRSDRYPSARALQAALEQALARLGTAIGPADIAQVVDRFCPAEPPTADRVPAAAPSVGPIITEGAPRYRGRGESETSDISAPVEHEWATDEAPLMAAGEHEWPTHEEGPAPVADHEWPTREEGPAPVVDPEWPTHEGTELVTDPVSTVPVKTAPEEIEGPAEPTEPARLPVTGVESVRERPRRRHVLGLVIVVVGVLLALAITHRLPV